MEQNKKFVDETLSTVGQLNPKLVVELDKKTCDATFYLCC